VGVNQAGDHAEPPPVDDAVRGPGQTCPDVVRGADVADPRALHQEAGVGEHRVVVVDREGERQVLDQSGGVEARRAIHLGSGHRSSVST
jgi:hypothetical protein